jgi:hypothetical protein
LINYYQMEPRFITIDDKAYNIDYIKSIRCDSNKCTIRLYNTFIIMGFSIDDCNIVYKNK